MLKKIGKTSYKKSKYGCKKKKELNLLAQMKMK